MILMIDDVGGETPVLQYQPPLKLFRLFTSILRQYFFHHVSQLCRWGRTRSCPPASCSPSPAGFSSSSPSSWRCMSRSRPSSRYTRCVLMASSKFSTSILNIPLPHLSTWRTVWCKESESQHLKKLLDKFPVWTFSPPGYKQKVFSEWENMRIEKVLAVEFWFSLPPFIHCVAVNNKIVNKSLLLALTKIIKCVERQL